MKYKKTIAPRREQVQISISLPAKLVEKIDAAAMAVMRARSNFIACALESILSDKPPKDVQSMLEKLR